MVERESKNDISRWLVKLRCVRLRRSIGTFYLLAQKLVFCKLKSRQIAYEDAYDLFVPHRRASHRRVLVGVCLWGCTSRACISQACTSWACISWNRRASYGHVSHGRVPYRRHLHLIGVYLTGVHLMRVPHNIVSGLHGHRRYRRFLPTRVWPVRVGRPPCWHD